MKAIATLCAYTCLLSKRKSPAKSDIAVQIERGHCDAYPASHC
jgi:hypothetical protein